MRKDSLQASPKKGKRKAEVLELQFQRKMFPARGSCISEALNMRGTTKRPLQLSKEQPRCEESEVHIRSEGMKELS